MLLIFINLNVYFRFYLDFDIYLHLSDAIKDLLYIKLSIKVVHTC